MFRNRIGLMIVIVLLVIPVFAIANSMEPPGLVVVIEGNNDITDAWLEYDEVTASGYKKSWAFETQYWFYYYGGYRDGKDVALHITFSDIHKIYILPELEQYHTTYTIDLQDDQVILGKSKLRTILLVSSRVFLTMLFEGIVFWFLGFRKKSSWMLFIVINLVTQTALNLYMNGLQIAVSYPIIILVIAEFWILLFETIGFAIALREHSVMRRIGYAFLGNLVSLLLGGYILTTWLPI